MTDTMGQVAFISGGGGAIGFGLGRACLDAGMKVALADVRDDLLADNVAALGGASDRLMSVHLDVIDPESWAAAAEAVERRLGPVTTLFNNAGVSSSKAILAGGGIMNLSLEEWRWTLSVNLDGVFLGMKTFLPRFLAGEGRAHIINTSSMAGLVPMRIAGLMPVSYSASKSGVNHMSAQLRTELHEQGVTHVGISILYPGLTKSNIFFNSLELAPGTKASPVDTESSRLNAENGADPVLVGHHALRAIERGDFHIFPAMDYRDGVLAYLAEVQRSFVENADDSFRDFSADKVDLNWTA